MALVYLVVPVIRKGRSGISFIIDIEKTVALFSSFGIEEITVSWSLDEKKGKLKKVKIHGNRKVDRLVICNWEVFYATYVVEVVN